MIEIVLRAYIMLRHYAEHGETKIILANQPKYRSMLLSAHAVAALANAGKVTLYTGNPLAINYAEWMALFRYLLPSLKYWLFDRSRLKLEHLEKVNEDGWNDLLAMNAQIVGKLAVSGFPNVALGIARQGIGVDTI